MKRNYTPFRFKSPFVSCLEVIPYDGREWITDARAIVDYSYVYKKYKKVVTLTSDNPKCTSVQYIIPRFDRIFEYQTRINETKRVTTESYGEYTFRIFFDQFNICILGDYYGWFAEMAKNEEYALFTSGNRCPISLIDMKNKKVVGVVMPYLGA